MRRLLLSQLLVLLSFALAAPATAGPITGQPIAPASEDTSSGGESSSDEETVRQRGLLALAAFDTGVLFDHLGLPLLRLSAPIYLKLGVAGPAAEASSEGGGDLGNLGWTPPPIPVPQPPGSVPEPAALLLCLPGALLAMRRFARKPPPLRT